MKDEIILDLLKSLNIGNGGKDEKKNNNVDIAIKQYDLLIKRKILNEIKEEIKKK
jgi:hypothetical protein